MKLRLWSMGRSRRMRVLLTVALVVPVLLGAAALAYPVVVVERTASLVEPAGTAPGTSPPVAAASPSAAPTSAPPSVTPTAGTTAPPPTGPIAPPFPAPAGKAGLLSTARANANEGDYLFKFTYGYVESRFKFPATQGFFTASANKGKFNNGARAVKDYANGFVRIGVDWQPNRIAWYIDGVKCAEFTNAAAIENGPMQLILHMMVDNDWQRSRNVGLTDPTLTRRLEVDYIRVFQTT